MHYSTLNGQAIRFRADSVSLSHDLFVISKFYLYVRRLVVFTVGRTLSLEITPVISELSIRIESLGFRGIVLRSIKDKDINFCMYPRDRSRRSS